jgi:hypothetical protein
VIKDIFMLLSCLLAAATLASTGCGVLRKDCKVSRGRFKQESFAGGGLEFRTAQEKASIARSDGARKALAISDGLAECAFDVFGGSIGKVVMFGTGYAALTRLLVGRLVQHDLVSKALFLRPKLYQIVDFSRGRQDPTLPMKFTITGFSAFVPSVKNLRLIRLSGTDVMNNALVEQIERWLRTRGREEGASTNLRSEPPSHPLQYQALRLKAVGALSGAAVSLSLAADGVCKMWLRKSAVNLPEFAKAVSTLQDLGEFETTAEPPTSWSEEAEV